MKKFVIIILTLLIASCSNLQKKESPVIYFSNSSDSAITDLQCVWVENQVLSLPYLAPGDTRSQSFYINSNEEFFGYVSIAWRNSSGKKIVREFDFKDNNLPSIKNERSYDFVQFYLDQDEFEIISSDAPDLTWKTQKMDKLLVMKKRNYLIKKGDPASALISIRQRGADPIPNMYQ